MFQRLWSRVRRAGGRRPAGPGRRPFLPAVSGLEPRTLSTFGVGATAHPNILYPPNGRYVPVLISGTFTEFNVVQFPKGGYRLDFLNKPGPKMAAFQVVDEYRQNQLSGPITMTDQGNGKFSYEFTIHLQAKRATEYKAGRRYYITVAAHDSDGWAGLTIPVLVPHGLPPAPANHPTAVAASSHAASHAPAHPAAPTKK